MPDNERREEVAAGFSVHKLGKHVLNRRVYVVVAEV
jgi:hypothetical protein